MTRRVSAVGLLVLMAACSKSPTKSSSSSATATTASASAGGPAGSTGNASSTGAAGTDGTTSSGATSAGPGSTSASSSGATSSTTTSATSASSSATSASSASGATTGTSGGPGSSTGTSASSSSSSSTSATATGTTGATTGTAGTSGSSGGTTGGALRDLCDSCTDASQCASGYCNTFSGPGFCDTSFNCTADSQCGGFACDTGQGSCRCRTPGMLVDCTGHALRCDPGQDCAPASAGSSETYCQCSPGDPTSGTPDSCAGNADGRVVCDGFSASCRAPTDFEPCAPASAPARCAAGYACVTDPQSGEVCVLPCQADTDCRQTYQHCAEDPLGAAVDGGPGRVCEASYCGPGAAPDGGDLGDYYGPCDVDPDAGTWGICQPWAYGGGYLTGLCTTGGQQQPGQPCDYGLAVGACTLGSDCYYQGGPQPTLCRTICNAAAPDSGYYEVTCPSASAGCVADDPTVAWVLVPGSCQGESDAGFAVGPHAAWPQVPDQGGAVFGAVQMVTITFDNDANRAGIDAYADWLPTSAWAGLVGLDYGSLTSLTNTNVHLPGNAPTGLTGQGIADLLTQKIQGGELPANGPGSFYFLYFPPGAVVGDPGFVPCVTYEAYHSWTTMGSDHVAYAVMPNCGNGLSDIEGSASHELGEGAADPWPGLDTAWTFTDPNSAWTDTGGELADMCEFGLTGSQSDGAGHTYAPTWSNSAAQTDGNPCLPALPGVPFVAASGEPTDVVYVAATGAPQTVSYTVRAWSNAPAAPWWQTASVYSGFDSLPALSSQVLGNGQTAVLTLTIPASAVSGDHSTVGLDATPIAPGTQDTAQWRVEVKVQ